MAQGNWSVQGLQAKRRPGNFEAQGDELFPCGVQGTVNNVDFPSARELQTRLTRRKERDKGLGGFRTRFTLRFAPELAARGRTLAT